MFDFLRRHRREAIRAQPLSDEARATIAHAVHLWAFLQPAQQKTLIGTIQVFLAEKTFAGAGGLTMTDEMRWTIAAQACVLLINRETDIFPDLDTVVVYPHPYVAHAVHRDGAVVVEGPEVRLGESWQRGVVVLAWDEVQSNTRTHHSGHNVVLHEFAHQLDAEDGEVNGAPALGSRSRYASWAHVLGEEFHALGIRLRKGFAGDVDPYAATNPAEFFAVITEEFFEKPDVLHAKHPALYRELAEFYQIDPAELFANRAGERTPRE